MPDLTRDVSPGPSARTVRTADGTVLGVPDTWDLLPPGDAGLTRRVKTSGATWTVKERKGRRTFSRGVWAPRETIERIRAELEHERDDPAWQKRLERSRRRRELAEREYVGSFADAVERFLAFVPPHEDLGRRVASAIARHATPVGSGTVARTKRIPVEHRAEAATIAWLRHQTTGYDTMRIPRVKGMRREVRRMLAARSRELLGRYRRGEPVPARACLLRAALDGRDRRAADDAEHDLGSVRPRRTGSGRADGA